MEGWGGGETSLCSCRYSSFQPCPLEIVSKCYFSLVPFTNFFAHPGKFEKTWGYCPSQKNFFGGFMVKQEAGLVSILYYLRSVDYINFLHSISSSTKHSKTPCYNSVTFSELFEPIKFCHFLIYWKLCFIPSDCTQLKVFLTSSESIPNQRRDNFRILHTNRYSCSLKIRDFSQWFLKGVSNIRYNRRYRHRWGTRSSPVACRWLIASGKARIVSSIAYLFKEECLPCACHHVNHI